MIVISVLTAVVIVIIIFAIAVVLNATVESMNYIYFVVVGTLVDDLFSGHQLWHPCDMCQLWKRCSQLELYRHQFIKTQADNELNNHDVVLSLWVEYMIWRRRFDATETLLSSYWSVGYRIYVKRYHMYITEVFFFLLLLSVVVFCHLTEEAGELLNRSGCYSHFYHNYNYHTWYNVYRDISFDVNSLRLIQLKCMKPV